MLVKQFLNRSRCQSINGYPRVNVAAVVWLVCCAATLLQAAEEPIVGFVLNLSGKWVIVNGPKNSPIAGGDQLPGGLIVRPEGKFKNAYLRVCLYDGTTVDYKQEETLPRREEESLANRIWSAVAGRYRGSAVQAASRGDELLSDGVASLQASQLDLTSLFSELPDGTWTFHIFKTGIPSNAASQSEPTKWTATVKWTAGEVAKVDADGMNPGLYELQLINPRTKRRIGAAVMFFACPAEVYEKRVAAYQEAVKLTETWSDEIRDDTAVPFLRAYLDVLANSEK